MIKAGKDTPQGFQPLLCTLSWHTSWACLFQLAHTWTCLLQLAHTLDLSLPAGTHLGPDSSSCQARQASSQCETQNIACEPVCRLCKLMLTLLSGNDWILLLRVDFVHRWSNTVVLLVQASFAGTSTQSLAGPPPPTATPASTPRSTNTPTRLSRQSSSITPTFTGALPECTQLVTHINCSPDRMCAVRANATGMGVPFRHIFIVLR